MKKRSSGQERTTNLGLGKVPNHSVPCMSQHAPASVEAIETLVLRFPRSIPKSVSCLLVHDVAPPLSGIPATGLQLWSRSPHAVSTKQMFPPSFPLDHGSLAQECQICPNSPWAQIRQTTNSIQNLLRYQQG